MVMWYRVICPLTRYEIFLIRGDLRYSDHVFNSIMTSFPQPVPVDLKSFYLSDKKPDKMLQEGIFTIFNEIDEMKSELKAMLKPNGSQQAPARSCYDLFLCNPSFEEGQCMHGCVLYLLKVNK